MYRVSQQVLDSDLAKTISKSQKTKNSWQFLYIIYGPLQFDEFFDEF